jgi:hypothetical protein
MTTGGCLEVILSTEVRSKVRLLLEGAEIFLDVLPKGRALFGWFLLLEVILVAVPNLESSFVFYYKS